MIDFVRRYIEQAWFFPVITTLLFILAILLGAFGVSSTAPSTVPWKMLTQAVTALAFVFLGGWFLHAFTHADTLDADDHCLAEQRASMFRFAYMFSVYSFALLVLPFTAMLRTIETPPDAGPIRLLRACMETSAATSLPASPPDGTAASAATRPAPTGATPSPAAPASAAASLVDWCPTQNLLHDYTYPWVVSVGGVVAQRCGGDGVFACPPSSPASAAGADDKLLPVYSIRGGFVVPFYVVLFAFVGGVVNLTRRVPEYQKRSSCHFVGTPTETGVSLLEAREFVVFQLMQLLSSPFVAMVAHYAIRPDTVASAVGLAFVSGFATESVLLLIRGVVNGLRPETTKTSAATSSSALLHVVVKRSNGLPASQCKVALRRLQTSTASLKEEKTNADGKVDFKSLAAGALWVVATLDEAGPPPKTSTASKQVDLRADEIECVELTVV